MAQPHPPVRSGRLPSALRDLRGSARDDAAAARDEAAVRRDEQPGDGQEKAHAALDRRLAAEDRVAASRDRQSADEDRRQSAQELERAHRDQLTGLLDRGAGRDQLDLEIQRAHRTDAELVVAFLDVDHLKQINDGQGHRQGDAVLRAVGDSLRSGLRAYDTLVRYGGDEFVCGLPGLSLGDADVRFREVNRLIHEACPDSSVSVGLAVLEPGDTLDMIVQRSDLALYEGRRPPTAA